MKQFHWSHAIAAGLATLLIGIFTIANYAENLGAHPWWAQSVGYRGIAIGLIIWFVLILFKLPNRWIFILAATTTTIAAITAWIAKMRFSASFAEDTQAGIMWFFGWNVVMIAAFLLIAAVTYMIIMARKAAP